MLSLSLAFVTQSSNPPLSHKYLQYPSSYRRGSISSESWRSCFQNLLYDITRPNGARCATQVYPYPPTPPSQLAIFRLESHILEAAGTVSSKRLSDESFSRNFPQKKRAASFWKKEHV